MRLAPLGWWLIVVWICLPGPSAQAFDYFEHRWIGDVACQWAKTRVAPELECQLIRGDPQQPENVLTFGDLVALAADHFETPDELQQAIDAWNATQRRDSRIDAVLPAREHQLRGLRGWLMSTDLPEKTGDIAACAVATPWLKVGASQGTMDQCIGALERRIAAARRKHWEARRRADCYVPTAYDDAAIVATPDRLALAIDDQLHFGKRAEQAFNLHQTQAVELFQQDLGPGLEVSSVVRLAFALHFFTDRFAAGHIRTDPMQAVREVKRRHGFDNEFGMRVQAAEPRIALDGEAPQILHWQAYGEPCLLGLLASEHRAIVAAATAAVIVDSLALGSTPARSAVAGRQLPFEFPAVSARDREQGPDRSEVDDSKLFQPIVASFGGSEDEDGDNSPVPPPPDLVRVLLRPTLGCGAAKDAGDAVRPACMFGAASLLQVLSLPRMINGFGMAALLSSRGQQIANVFASFDLTPVHRIAILGLRGGFGFADRSQGVEPDALVGLDVRVEPPSPYAFGLSLDYHVTTASGDWLLTLAPYFESAL